MHFSMFSKMPSGKVLFIIALSPTTPPIFFVTEKLLFSFKKYSKSTSISLQTLSINKKSIFLVFPLSISDSAVWLIFSLNANSVWERFLVLRSFVICGPMLIIILLFKYILKVFRFSVK